MAQRLTAKDAYLEGKLSLPWLRARARRGRAAVAQGRRVGGGHVQCRGCGPGGGGANRGRRSREERQEARPGAPPREMRRQG